MKKTLLSILAGVAVIGSASAVPSPSDRKALCEQNPEKFVWVEKTQACIPINPCKSDDIEIMRAYCLSREITPSKKELLINEYVKNVLKTNVVSIQNMSDSDSASAYSAVKTQDGGYFVLRVGNLAYSDSNYDGVHSYMAYTHEGFLKDMINAAALVYASGEYCEEQTDEFKNHLCEFHNIDIDQCHNLIMFAEKLADELPNGRYEKETRVCSFSL